MESLRLAPGPCKSAVLPCCRCQSAERRWDRIGEQAYCPECQEALILGVSAPLTLRTESQRCAVCSRQGTIRFLTFPLHSNTPVEIDLCGEHLRALLGRRLGPYAFHQLRRRLQLLGLDVELIFLLHEAFYDVKGKALQPAVETE